jgi:hypothetical protein
MKLNTFKLLLVTTCCLPIFTNAQTITTVAGNGIIAYSGDNGPATAASLHQPYGVALGKSGELYIVDSWNSCIRKVSETGVITTVAGIGMPGYSGDKGPATAAMLN